MLRYVLKRLVYGVFVLIAVSLLMFFMSSLAPGDHIASHLALEGSHSASRIASYSQRNKEYERVAQRLGMDLPWFYFSIQPWSFPDTLHRVIRKDERQAGRKLLLKHGNWSLIDKWRSQIIRLIEVDPASTLTPTQTNAVRSNAEFLLTTADSGRIRFLLQSIRDASASDTGSMQNAIENLHQTYQELQSTRSGLPGLFPSFNWHGTRNQYHQWISRLLRGDLGRSLIDGRPVKAKIKEALRWTLQINLTSILLAFGIAIPLGVAAARRAGKMSDKVISGLLFAFFAVPSFWLAMLCIVFFTTSEYGTWLDWFPTGGVGMVNDRMSDWDRFEVRLSHLILPVFCILVGSLAYLTRQMRGAMLREMRQDYVRMARAKGLSERRVYWRHALRNALFPMITMVGSAFPAAISGSVIIEVIFSIPGMGRLMYMSILSRDWPVVFAVVMLAAILTIIGYLVSDLLYRAVNPAVDLQTPRP